MICAPSLLTPLMPFKRVYFEQTNARLQQLEKFDELARKTLEQRKLRYEEWRTWRSDLINSTSVLRLKYKPRNSLAPNDSTMVAAYDHAGQSRIPYLNSPIDSNLYQRYGGQTICQQG